MKSGRFFAVLGVLVALGTAGMIAAKRMTPRAEPLLFSERAPKDTVFYASFPDHAAFTDSACDAPAWKALKLDRWIERYAAARPRLKEIAGPSAAVFVRRDGSWAVLFRLRGSSERQTGELSGFHWIAEGDAIAVSDSAAAAESILLGPTMPLDVAEDRIEVCGAARTPFAWLDLRPWLDDDGTALDIGAVAFTASFSDVINVRAIGNYFIRARPRVIRDFIHRPPVVQAPPPDAALWVAGFASATDLWPALLNALKPEEREAIRNELDRLSVEFLKQGSVEKDVIPRIGPSWGAALVDRPHPLLQAWIATPAGFEPMLRRFSDDFAEYRRRRELDPFWTLEGEKLRSSFLPSSNRIDPSVVFEPDRLAMSTWTPPPSLVAAPGRWHIGAGLDVARLREWLDEADRTMDLKAVTGRLRGLLDRLPGLASATLRGRYTDRGLMLELTFR